MPAQQFIPHAGFSPPPPSWGSLARPRLLARLDEGRSRRLTLLVAPAGYGKTTLLGQWVSRQAEGERVWCTLEEREADLYSFLTRLSAALAPILPQAVARVREFLADPQAGLDPVLPLLLEGLAALNHPLVLILDDVQYVEKSAEVLKALDRMLGHAPSHLHLILSTRREPPLPSISRLRAAGQVFELTAEELRFTPAEVARLFATVFNLPLDEETTAQLAKRTEGWAAALQLAYQAGVRYGPAEAKRILRRFGGTTRRLYDYLARVVLEGQPEEVRSFLRRTSILEHLEPALCDALLERDDSLAVLAYLERSGLFTLPDDLARTSYRYHLLFREFLHRRLMEVEGRETVRRLHRRAAAWLLERGDDERAFTHLLEAEDYEAAAELLHPLGKQLFAASRYQLLEDWLKQFPTTFTTTHPWLLLMQGELASTRGEYDVAERLYRQAEPLLQEREDTAGLYSLYYGLAVIAGARDGDFAAAEALARRALTYAPTDDDAAAALGKIAQCRYITQGAVPEVFDFLDRALERAEKARNPLRRASLLVIKGGALSSRGDFTAALDAWHTALDLMEAHGNRHKQIAVLENAAYHHCMLGQLDQAETLARRALELARLLGREALYGHGLNVLGFTHRAQGRLEEAQRCHREALTIHQRLDIKYEIAPALSFLALVARRRGQPDEALRLGEEALNHYERMDNAFECGAWLIEMGAIHLAREEDAQAEEMWRQAEAIITPAEARYEQTKLHFYLAVLAHHRGAEDGLAEHLEQAMALARAYEHDTPPRCLHFFVEEAAWTVPLMIHALRRGLVPECAECLLSRLGRPAFDALLPLLDDPDPSIRARAARILVRLGDAAALKPLAAHRDDPDPTVRQAVGEALQRLLAAPPEPLRVHTLGGFRLRRGDREIARWPRRSARDVFLLLLDQAPRPVPKERLMEALWPGSPSEKAAQNLRRAVADLRRALEPELPAGFPSRYLSTGDETYTLELPPESWVDFEEFETRVRQLLDRAQAPTPEELESVLALYRGDYLPEALYEDWTTLRRERLRELHLRALQRLGEIYLDSERYREAATAARRILEQDPWSEEATLLLMQACERLDDIPAALRAYEAHRDRLRRDLDLPPRDDLTALYNHLRRR